MSDGIAEIMRKRKRREGKYEKKRKRRLQDKKGGMQEKYKG